MTKGDRNIKLKHLITCMKCEVSGKVCDENCSTHKAGNMGEIIENLEAISEILEQQPCEDWYDVPSDEMTLEQARQAVKDLREKLAEYLKQQPCDMKQRVEKEYLYESLCEDLKRANAEIKRLSEPFEDAISRQAVDELSKELVHTTRDKADFLCNFWEGLQKLPPVTPKEKTGWIPVTYRLMTEEEKKYYEEYTDCDLTEIFDCPMPEDGQEILISISGGYVCADVCSIDDKYGVGLESHDSWEDVIAWMPLPKPYEPQERG